MKVRLVSERPPPLTVSGVWPPDSPWHPERVLGATSAGGLRLPDAHASASTLYGPRGVWLDDERVIVADTGNHRVMIWHDGPDADVILGQPDAYSDGEGLFHLPTGVLVDGARLIVADAWHHRILVWDDIPDVDRVPDHVLEAGFHWPFGVAVIDGRFYVADTGNRRVLVWSDGLPLDGQAADVVLGQPDSRSREENRFRWPHALCTDGAGGILVADAGLHRVWRWREHPAEDGPGELHLGQADGTEFPYVSQEGRLRFPYGLAAGAVADTANNRILLDDTVLGQPDQAANGENRWHAVADDTLCWPYGLDRHGDRLAVADSGNNRVVIWSCA